jgi:hypothetical protein
MNNQYYKHKMDDLLRWFGQAYVPIGAILVELEGFCSCGHLLVMHNIDGCTVLFPKRCACKKLGGAGE